MGLLLRQHAEQQFEEELHELKKNETNKVPENWQLSPQSVVTYLMGGKLANGFEVTPKYIGHRRLMEIAVATLVTDRALLLYGLPGTAKSWVSEHLAAAISGDSTLIVQGTAGTGEEAIRYGWNYAKLLAEGVFTITGRGTVATGRVERGVLHLNEEVEIVGIKEETRKTVVTGIEMFRKLLDQAEAGDNIGALLRGVQRTDIQRGQCLVKPGSVKCHKKFTAQVYVLTKDEGGRHTPFFNNYRPQFYFRTTDVTGVCNLPEGTEMCMPGDNIEMTIELIHPIAMSQGLTFAIREGGRTVGSGRVATIIE